MQPVITVKQAASPQAASPTGATPDRDDLLHVVNQDDPLQVIIRGHLKVESELITLIEADLQRPEALDLNDLNFPVKVDLAIAMNLIPKHYRPIMRRLNLLRNRFAHNLDSEVTQQDIDVMWGHLDEHSREVLREVDIKQKATVGQLGGILLVIYFGMQRFAQFHADRRAGRLLVEDSA